MICVEARQHWELYLDSEGSPELHLRVRRHLGSCPACASWFSRQQWLEREINQALGAGDPTSDIWERVLARSGIRGRGIRRRPLLIGAACAAAAIAVVVLVIAFQGQGEAHAELTRDAADWHTQWQAGRFRPELMSRSHQEIEDFLKTRCALPWRCPPAQAGGFQGLGAGVRLIGGREAPYIVGLLGDAAVSIVVLDKADTAERHDGAAYRQGDYRVVVGVVGDKLVVITGMNSVASLQRLLDQVRKLAIAPDDFPRI
jgi:hypothetical protein